MGGNWSDLWAQNTRAPTGQVPLQGFQAEPSTCSGWGLESGVCMCRFLQVTSRPQGREGEV